MTRSRKRVPRAISPNDGINREWVDADDEPNATFSAEQIEHLIAAANIPCPSGRKGELKRRLNRRVAFWAIEADEEHLARQDPQPGGWRPPRANDPWRTLWKDVAAIFEDIFSRKARVNHHGPLWYHTGELKQDGPFPRFAIALAGMLGQSLTASSLQQLLRADKQPKYKPR